MKRTVREYLDSKKEIQHNVQPFVEKRVYIKDPSQAPAGANVQVSKHGGHYYDTDSGMGKAPADDADVDMTADQDIEKVINMMSLSGNDAEDIYQELERRFGPEVAMANRDEISKSVGQEEPSQGKGEYPQELLDTIGDSISLGGGNYFYDDPGMADELGKQFGMTGDQIRDLS
ncbi:MAG: hypothetical protein KAQ92_01850, partial [Candidatus Aenigmarchaeota archaeon]|nr:hypothetical protein [Candidatus Aenigmarchaeota archaeon]